MEANIVFKNGFYQTKSKSFKDKTIRQCLVNFIAREKEYKSKYLQKNYNYGFDGYSFMGQKDSSNQYFSDLLHSFVISDFQEKDNFPKEFFPFFKKYWLELQTKIKNLELEIIIQLNYPGLEEFYLQNIGHMISCNYYPPQKEVFSMETKIRLSEHTDVSLFTIFPFGFDSDFYFENLEGEWINIPPTDDIIVFPGYLLECFTQKKWKALNHKVALSQSEETERFSFAYFSLPYPKRKFLMAGEGQTSENYFKKYLELF